MLLDDSYIHILINMTIKRNQAHQTARQIFAQNMRTIRRLKEISQENLAFDAEVSRAYIGEVERGNRSVSIDVMGRIAEALDVPLSDLLKEQLSLSDYV